MLNGHRVLVFLYQGMFQDELQTFSSVYISVDSTEHEIIVFNSPVIISKKNQINAQGAEKSNYIIKIK